MFVILLILSCEAFKLNNGLNWVKRKLESEKTYSLFNYENKNEIELNITWDKNYKIYCDFYLLDKKLRFYLNYFYDKIILFDKNFKFENAKNKIEIKTFDCQSGSCNYNKKKTNIKLFQSMLKGDIINIYTMQNQYNVKLKILLLNGSCDDNIDFINYSKFDGIFGLGLDYGKSLNLNLNNSVSEVFKKRYSKINLKEKKLILTDNYYNKYFQYTELEYNNINENVLKFESSLIFRKYKTKQFSSYLKFENNEFIIPISLKPEFDNYILDCIFENNNYFCLKKYNDINVININIKEVNFEINVDDLLLKEEENIVKDNKKYRRLLIKYEKNEELIIGIMLLKNYSFYIDSINNKIIIEKIINSYRNTIILIFCIITIVVSTVIFVIIKYKLVKDIPVINN